VDDVVDVEPIGIDASREGAAATVAFVDGAAKAGGDKTVPSADVDDLSLLVMQQRRQDRVTRQSAGSSWADRGAVVEVSASGMVGG
jgi:hypothetical protein